MFKSHPFGMLQLDFSRDFRRRSVHTAGPLLREPKRLHGMICWEASKIAAGSEVSLAPKAPGRCRETGCPLHRLHREQVWPGQPSCRVLPSDVVVGGLNPAQGALIYDLL